MWKFVLFFCLFAARALADVPAQVDLLPGWRTDRGTHVVALRIRLAPGWKTYWRSPGDAGIPPAFDWSGSDNLRDMRIHWPLPRLFDSQGMQVIGYRGELILPLEFATPARGAPARLSGHVDLGLCNEICTAQRFVFEARLPAGGAPDPAVQRAMAERPAAGREVLRCALDEAGKLGVVLPAPVASGSGMALEMPGVILGQPGWRVEGGQTRIVSRIYGAAAIARQDIRLTVIAPEGGAVEYRGCVGS